MKKIIYTQNHNIEHYSLNINAIRECAEQVLKQSDENKDIYILVQIQIAILL